MNWFYVKNGAQTGPVDEAALDELFRSGAITAETLIWKAGMESWQPYSLAFGAPDKMAPAPYRGLVRCAECGQEFPPEQVISLAGRSICGACKPTAVQKFKEGVVGFGHLIDAEALWQKVEQRGFDFTILSVLSRSWNLVASNFWPCVGVTLLCYLIMMAASQIPLLGVILVQAQIMAGIGWYFVKQFRGESATLNDAFAGFQRGFGQQALYMLIFFAIVFGVLIACGILMALIIPAVSAASKADGASWFVAAMAIVLVPIILATWYFIVCCLFTPLLILDKGLNATAAMKLSRRVVRLRFWKLLGLLLVIALLCILSLVAAFVGIVFMLPIAFAAISRVYEDAFGEEGPVAAG